jgi:hypothetical protein
MPPTHVSSYFDGEIGRSLIYPHQSGHPAHGILKSQQGRAIEIKAALAREQDGTHIAFQNRIMPSVANWSLDN